jgi:WD40 repeat protein
LDEVRQGSIFNLKSEDYLDLILIKSREFFLFTIERQKIEFFNAQTFKRSDSWDYFFERDIVGCDKNHEGSKIFVWDKGGHIVLFNFLKPLEPVTKENHIPSHRKFDPVICIDVTEKLNSNQIISCSLDRDLRVWDRSNGMFVKKYDLSSFTSENVSAIKLGKTDGMLFLGSKDMNVYLIDVLRGKLSVVYEGHWSRVTSIYTIPGKDILVTLSESNIKIWDLEYDECIKNMNEHSSLIIYCALSS